MSRPEDTTPADDSAILETGQPEPNDQLQLAEAVRNLTHEVLIARDVEFGLRAEIYRLQDAISTAHNATHATVAEIKSSRTWRLGSVVMKPLSVFRPRRSGAEQ